MKVISRAAIIAVGSELLTPSKVDTNSLFITEQLNLLGIEVTAKAVVGDDRAEALGDLTQLQGERLFHRGVGATSRRRCPGCR